MDCGIESVTKVTEEQYLAIDRAAEFRSELLDGEMIAMSGGIDAAWSSAGEHLRRVYICASGDAECEAFGSDLRVRVSARMYTYPGYLGGLRKATPGDDAIRTFFLTRPLFSRSSRHPLKNTTAASSSSTIAPLIRSRTISSWHQDQSALSSTCARQDNTWTLRDHQTLEEELKIASIGVSLPLSRIYDRVELPPAA